MSQNHLLREHAPISDKGWELLDKEAREHLTVALGARKLVDFVGPLGWEHSATNLGRVESIPDPLESGITANRRRTLSLVEVRSEFSVDRSELLANDAGAADVDLQSLDDAAIRMASAENTAVLHGWPQASMAGVTDSSTNPKIPRVEDFNDYPKRVAKAVAMLLRNGIGGPFGMAMGPGHYTAVMEFTERGGYLLADHLRNILGGPLIWAPGVSGAIVVSLRGGDFLFESGQDLSVGYSHHDADSVHLYLEQSFSFRVATPEAAVWLTGSTEGGEQ